MSVSMRARSLEARLVGASVVVAAIVAFVFAVLVLTVSELRTATVREARSKDRTAAALELEKLTLDIETGARGFAITGNARFLEPWSQARRALPASLATFERRFADSPRRTKAEELGRLIESYVRDYSVPLVRLSRAQPKAARQPVTTLEGKRRIDAIRSRFDGLLAFEDRATAADAASARMRARRAILAGLVGLGLSALLIVVYGISLARSIARPLRSAAAGATRVAEGDLTARLEERGPGEVGELTRAFNDMTERLQRSRRELEEQNERLRESERLKAELIGIVSHELRTPLASILGFAELLRRREIEEPARSTYLEIVSDQSKRLATLLNDFLDAQQAEDGQMQLADERLDLAEILREQARVFVGQSDEHTIRVDVEQPLPVRGDPRRMTQVVANLLSNAIKYSPDGGVVKVAGEREARTVKVSVSDHGLGIPAEEQHRIFTKFFRGTAAASGITGTGLGLALSREIVEAHGGGIGFSSSPGTGSTFWLELPADETNGSSGARAVKGDA